MEQSSRSIYLKIAQKRPQIFQTIRFIFRTVLPCPSHPSPFLQPQTCCLTHNGRSNASRCSAIGAPSSTRRLLRRYVVPFLAFLQPSALTYLYSLLSSSRGAPSQTNDGLETPAKDYRLMRQPSIASSAAQQRSVKNGLSRTIRECMKSFTLKVQPTNFLLQTSACDKACHPY